jgi:hypothetical protein
MAGEPKTGHLVHTAGSEWASHPSSDIIYADTGRLVYHESLPSTFRIKKTNMRGWHSHFGSYFYCADTIVMTRESAQTLYLWQSTHDSNWAIAVALGADGYWHLYHYLGPNATLSKLKAAVDVPNASWQLASSSSTQYVYSTGGLSADWKHFVIRSRSKTLFGWYRLHSAIAYHPNCSTHRRAGASFHFFNYAERI